MISHLCLICFILIHAHAVELSIIKRPAPASGEEISSPYTHNVECTSTKGSFMIEV